MAAELDPTARVLVISFGRGVLHGLRPGGNWTWCGKRHPRAHNAVASRAVAITCWQCQHCTEAARGHLELIVS